MWGRTPRRSSRTTSTWAWRHSRLRGEEYDSLVDEFVHAVKHRFPTALLQWEDFKKTNAFRLLDKYRKVIACFNDDIQGTAAVAVAGILTGTRATGVALKDQRVVILGAGAAGIGIARLLRDTLREAGLSGDTLATAIANLDSHGLLVDDQPTPDTHKRAFALPAALAEKAGLGRGRPRDLEAVVRAVKPTVLIGASGEPGTFTEVIVRAMAAEAARPVIFPMSNPTSKGEAGRPDGLDRGPCARGHGEPVRARRLRRAEDQDRPRQQCLRVPRHGFGRPRLRSARGDGRDVRRRRPPPCGRGAGRGLSAGSLFPPPSEIRRVTAAIAEAVVRKARDERAGRQIPDEAIPEVVADAMWQPDYVPEDPV
jgi:malic enzyme